MFDRLDVVLDDGTVIDVFIETDEFKAPTPLPHPSEGVVKFMAACLRRSRRKCRWDGHGKFWEFWEAKAAGYSLMSIHYGDEN